LTFPSLVSRCAQHVQSCPSYHVARLGGGTSEDQSDLLARPSKIVGRHLALLEDGEGGGDAGQGGSSK